MSAMYERYEIYVSCMKDSGEYVKTFQEWLDSQTSSRKIVLDDLVKSKYNTYSKREEGFGLRVTRLPFF